MPDNTINIELQKVPLTLLLPLWGRAELSRAGSPILHDKEAIEIISRLDYDFSRIRATLNYSNNICWLARARQFDDKIKEFMSKHPGCTVVNLGAGLDTTFSRVDDGAIRWIDFDLPEVIEIRKKLIPETERSICMTTSVFDYSWMDQLPNNPHGLIFVAGGLFIYFKDTELKALFREMGKHFHGAEIVFDAFLRPAWKKPTRCLKRRGWRNRCCNGVLKTLAKWNPGRRESG